MYSSEDNQQFKLHNLANLNWEFLALPDVNFVSTVCSVLPRGPKMKKSQHTCIGFESATHHRQTRWSSWLRHLH